MPMPQHAKNHFLGLLHRIQLLLQRSSISIQFSSQLSLHLLMQFFFNAVYIDGIGTLLQMRCI